MVLLVIKNFCSHAMMELFTKHAINKKNIAGNNLSNRMITIVIKNTTPYLSKQMQVIVIKKLHSKCLDYYCSMHVAGCCMYQQMYVVPQGPIPSSEATIMHVEWCHQCNYDILLFKATDSRHSLPIMHAI
jgi:hypothetical protein